MKVILIFLFILLVFYFALKKKDKRLYEINEICPKLKLIQKYHNDVRKEVININKITWCDWPEKYLYNSGDWKIFPFFAFDNFIYKNCKKCPIIFNFIKKIPNLKVALLSKLSPHTKLKSHNGWAFYSNYILRCHYGIIVPKKCYIVVKDKKGTSKKYHENNKWIIFDDSKMHYAVNNSSKERIILIIDVKRPFNVKKGSSTSEESNELIDLINYYKNIY